MKAFFDLLGKLIILFAIISAIVGIPQALIFTYQSGDVIDSAALLFSTTLGSSGYSYIYRILIPISVNQTYLFCENTLIEDFKDD